MKKVRKKVLEKKNSHAQYLFDVIAQTEWDTFFNSMCNLIESLDFCFFDFDP